MKFSKLSKEKKQQMFLTLLLTVGALVALGLGLIRYQYQTVDRLAHEKVSTEKKLAQVEDAVKRSRQIQVDLAEAKTNLFQMEADIASGDVYAWIINVLRNFQANYKVEIPTKSGVTPPADCTLIPALPYKQSSITVSGSAHFHDLGQFLADFENQYPHIRIVNLTVEDPQNNPASAGSEKLQFKLEIIFLVNPNAV